MAVIAKFVKMLNCMEHRDCPPDEEEKSQCLWPRYHADVAALEMNGEYMKIKINHINMGSSRQTRLQVQTGDLQLADGIPLFTERLKTLVWRMQNDLKLEVFEDKTVEMIENIRIVCNLKTLLINVKKKGAVIIGYENGQKILNAVRKKSYWNPEKYQR